MRRLGLTILLVAALATSGCLGSVKPAKIPDSDLQEHGWEQTRKDQASVANGLGERVVFVYQPSGSDRAGVSTISANDVPVFDESTLLPRLIQLIEKRRDIELNKTGQRELQLNNLDATVTADVYDVKGAPADANALLFTPPCSSFAAVLAYGTTGGGSDGGGFFGGGSEDGTSYYNQAVKVAKDVECA